MKLANLGSIVSKVRSKNAGPFWLTVDIFCDTPEDFQNISKRLETRQIAAIFKVDAERFKRFEIENLNVIKFSLPRPEIQGSIHDRDMHGASWAALIAEIDV